MTKEYLDVYWSFHAQRHIYPLSLCSLPFASTVLFNLIQKYFTDSQRKIKLLQ